MFLSDCAAFFAVLLLPSFPVLGYYCAPFTFRAGDARCAFMRYLCNSFARLGFGIIVGVMSPSCCTAGDLEGTSSYLLLGDQYPEACPL